MRVFILSAAVFLQLGALGHAQNQPEPLKGVYAPPGSSALGPPRSKSSALSAPGNGAVGAPPRVIVPGGDPVQGQTLPADVTPAPIPDRPGYGAVTVNGHRVIVDLRNNRIFQLLD